ncbi:hypothetical protein C8J56DRAFT_1098149 [Mycena floridula]|nr:hypothetical protein C8J56DRAFT_1098149 [Mycena floridula]
MADWSFNLRRGGYESDSDSDSEPHLPSSETDLINDLDLSTRHEEASFKPNPFNIARINAASRSLKPASTASSSHTTAVAAKPLKKATNNNSIVEWFKKPQKPKSIQSQPPAERPPAETQHNRIQMSQIRVTSRPAPAPALEPTRRFRPTAEPSNSSPLRPSGFSKANPNSFSSPVQSVSRAAPSRPPGSIPFRQISALRKPDIQSFASSSSTASYPNQKFTLTNQPNSHKAIRPISPTPTVPKRKIVDAYRNPNRVGLDEDSLWSTLPSSKKAKTSNRTTTAFSLPGLLPRARVEKLSEAREVKPRIITFLPPPLVVPRVSGQSVDHNNLMDTEPSSPSRAYPSPSSRRPSTQISALTIKAAAHRDQVSESKPANQPEFRFPSPPTSSPIHHPRGLELSCDLQKLSKTYPTIRANMRQRTETIRSLRDMLDLDSCGVLSRDGHEDILEPAIPVWPGLTES